MKYSPFLMNVLGFSLSTLHPTDAHAGDHPVNVVLKNVFEKKYAEHEAA